jgi:PP-loop superfamily ATP-utilizing enzyme
MSGLSVISYGGGVQSTAMLVLAARGELGYPVSHALFANVGDDSEHPASLDFVRSHAVQYGRRHDIEVVELVKTSTDGTPVTLRGLMDDHDNASMPIPMRGSITGAPGARSCTADFKIAVIRRWLRANGASKASPATVAIGISVDELHRASNKNDNTYERRVFPLLDLGLTRDDCHKIIADAGLPVVGKSSCYFCPFHRTQTWAEMRRDEPELFASSQELEDSFNVFRAATGRDPMYLTRFGKRLSDAIPMAQETLPFDWDDDGSCDSGHCFT